MTKSLIFDLCGVIVPIDYRRRYAMFEPLTPYSADEISQRIGASDLVQGLDTGKLAPTEFARGIFELLDLRPLSFDDFCRIWESVFQPPDTLIPEDFLERMHQQNRMILLSNTNAIHFPYLKANYPHLRHFDGYVLSYEVGATKPSSEMYIEAVKQANCEPGECLFIDDLETNVEGAKREGIRATQFRSFADLSKDFQKLNIGV